MRWLALLLAFSGVAAQAGEASLSWTPPTQNTDGSELTNLAGHRVVYGQSASALSSTIQIGNPDISAYVVTDLSPGTWYFAVKAYATDGVESALSNIASKTISEASTAPNPPDGLKVADTTVYQVIGTLDAFALIPVGTVPADTQCDPGHSVNGHYLVPRAEVTWYGSVRPQAVVAKCD